MTDIFYESDGVMIERVTVHGYIIRGYADGAGYPDEFEWIVVAIIDGSVATLKGFLHIKNGNWPLKHARLVDNFLRSIGCKLIKYEREKKGTMINVTRKL